MTFSEVRGERRADFSLFWSRDFSFPAPPGGGLRGNISKCSFPRTAIFLPAESVISDNALFSYFIFPREENVFRESFANIIFRDFPFHSLFLQSTFNPFPPSPAPTVLRTVTSPGRAYQFEFSRPCYIAHGHRITSAVLNLLRAAVQALLRGRSRKPEMLAPVNSLNRSGRACQKKGNGTWK